MRPTTSQVISGPVLAAWTIGLALLPSAQAFGQLSSLQPLYPENDPHVVFEPALAGVWAHEGSDLVVEVEDESKYRITARFNVYKGEEAWDRDDARLLRLDEFLLLELSPAELEGLLRVATVPAHIYCLIEIKPELFRIACPDSDWIEKKLEDGVFKAPHQVFGDGWDKGWVLTGSAEDLRTVLLQFARDRKAKAASSDSELEYRRQPPEQAHYLLGRWHKEMRGYEEAIAAYQAAIEIRPDFIGAYWGLAGSLSDAGRNREALAAYQKLRTLDPGTGLIESIQRSVAEDFKEECGYSPEAFPSKPTPER